MTNDEIQMSNGGVRTNLQAAIVQTAGKLESSKAFEEEQEEDEEEDWGAGAGYPAKSAEIRP